MNVSNVHTKARCRITVDVHIHVAAACETFGQCAADARHIFERLFNLSRQAVNDGQVSTCHLHTHRTFNTGCQHVDAIANRWHPNIGQAGHFDDAVKLIHQLVLRHAGSPLVFGLELNGCFEHFHRGRVGRRFGTTSFAVHAEHFGHGLDKPVGLLQQLTGLAS